MKSAAVRSHRAAFTLVELLISIVVSAVVLLAVYSFFMVQTRSYETQQMSNQIDANLRFAQDLLEKALQGAGAMSNTSATTCSYTGNLGEIDHSAFTVDQTKALECVQVIDSAAETAPDQVTTAVPDGSTLMRLDLGTTAGAGTDCKAAFATIVLDADDPSAYAAATTLCASSYRFVICSDYGHPGGPRSFIRKAPSCAPGTGTVQLSFPAMGSFADSDTACGSDGLGPFIECAGAQIYTFYVADNTESKLTNFAPADHALFVSSDLDLYMRSAAKGDADNPTVAGDSRADGLTTLADIPLSTGITDLQVSGCARGLSSATVGCTADSDWTTEFLQSTNMAFEQYRVGITARSDRTFPGKQTQTPPVLADGINTYTGSDASYMYRSTSFRVASMSRLDSL